MDSVTVLKMDDYEWWATRWSKERTHEYFLKEYGLDEDDSPFESIEACDIDKDGMWCETADKQDIERLGDAVEITGIETVDGMTMKKAQFGDLMRKDGEVFRLMPFREVIQKHYSDFNEPFCIACTEW